MTQNQKLLPCPFCGHHEAVEVIEMPRHEGFFQVICNCMEGGCGASSGGYEDLIEPIESWNTRTEIPHD